MALGFCRGSGSSMPALQEQTRGLRTPHGSREASECGGQEGCEMLQDRGLPLTLRRAAGPSGQSILCTGRNEPRRPRRRAEAPAAVGWERGGSRVGGFGTHRAPISRTASALVLFQLTNSFPVQGGDFLRS